MGKIQSSSGSSSRDSSVSIRSSVGNPPRMPRKDDQLPGLSMNLMWSRPSILYILYKRLTPSYY